MEPISNDPTHPEVAVENQTESVGEAPAPDLADLAAVPVPEVAPQWPSAGSSGFEAPAAESAGGFDSAAVSSEAFPEPVTPSTSVEAPEAPVQSSFDLGQAPPVEPVAVGFDAVAPVAPVAPADPYAPGASSLDLPALELPNTMPPAAPRSPSAAPLSTTPPDLPSAATGAGYSAYSAQESYGAPAEPVAQYEQPQFQQQTQAPQQSYAQQPYVQQAYSQPQQPYAQQPYAQQPYQQQSYQQGYAPMVPAGTLTPSEEATWVSAAHWSSLLASLISLPFLGPLIVMLTQGTKSQRVREAAVESLNADLTMMIGMLVSFVLMFVVIGFITMPIIGLLWFIFKIIALVKSSSGQPYRYPLTIRMVK